MAHAARPTAQQNAHNRPLTVHLVPAASGWGSDSGRQSYWEIGMSRSTLGSSVGQYGLPNSNYLPQGSPTEVRTNHSCCRRRRRRRSRRRRSRRRSRRRRRRSRCRCCCCCSCSCSCCSCSCSCFCSPQPPATLFFLQFSGAIRGRGAQTASARQLTVACRRPGQIETYGSARAAGYQYNNGNYRDEQHAAPEIYVGR